MRLTLLVSILFISLGHLFSTKFVVYLIRACLLPIVESIIIMVWIHLEVHIYIYRYMYYEGLNTNNYNIYMLMSRR